VDVVEASAGSGKTYALARRYIQLIMSPELKSEEAPLKTILAVTFTNKATLEMKQRILEFLKKIALDAFRDKHEKEAILSCLAVDKESAGRTAHRVMDDIITHYSAFGVQTIDSFINALLSGCAFSLGFASDFRVKEDYRAYLEYSLDRLIDRVPADRNILSAFEGFLEYYLFVENRGGWLSRRDILGLMESLYNYSNTYGGEFIVPDIKAGDLRKKKRIIIDLISRISKDIPEGTNGVFVNSLKSFHEKNSGGFDVGKLSAYFKREDFPMKKNAEPPERIVRLWKDVRRNLRELCEWESRAIFRSYIEIFTLVLDEFRELASRDDVIFLQELNTHANALVEGGTVSVEEFYYRLATRFRHYLIDEFQDTSRLQWRNVLPMIDEALSSGGSLFYVGDKKQAIYRFRGGDVSLFDSAGDSFTDYEPRRTALGRNYRSQREIVEFNNEIFSAQNLRRFIGEADALQEGPVGVSDAHINTVLNVFRDSEQEWEKENGDGYVGVEMLEADSVDERDSIVRGKLLSLVKDIKNRFSFGDIAILARENRDVKLFTSWLIEEGIPVESERTLNIREHPLIKELVSFLRFLDSPIDNLSFASFILGEVFLKAGGDETAHDGGFPVRVESFGQRRKRRLFLQGIQGKVY
jgi:ATP-dependent exoDNAse (exonuclease V) beta subunit